MRIIPISQQECSELLKRVSIGRLACSSNDQPCTQMEDGRPARQDGRVHESKCLICYHGGELSATKSLRSHGSPRKQ
jgi:hypothetical protein